MSNFSLERLNTIILYTVPQIAPALLLILGPDFWSSRHYIFVEALITVLVSLLLACFRVEPTVPLLRDRSLLFYLFACFCRGMLTSECFWVCLNSFFDLPQVGYLVLDTSNETTLILIAAGVLFAKIIIHISDLIFVMFIEISPPNDMARRLARWGVFRHFHDLMVRERDISCWFMIWEHPDEEDSALASPPPSYQVCAFQTVLRVISSRCVI